MSRSDYWAKPKWVREQAVLFAPTLDEMIPQDHEVRLLDEVLRGLNWDEWESHYLGGRGQPPIHPRVLAGIWLYAMMRRIRTSRPLEYTCGHNIDFIWLAEGRVPDHSTLSHFFSSFRKELKSLFQQVCKIAMTMGLIRLGEVAFDGTRVKASNGRYRTLSTSTLEERLRLLEERIGQIMSEVQAAEAAAEAAAGEVRRGDSASRLPSELASLSARQEKLKAALEIAKTLDQVRRSDGVDIAKNPAQVPMTDTDSRVMPNKEGGYAPNYTPTCLTDGQSGFILDVTVLNTINEHPEALPAVDRATEMYGESPENFLADRGMATGAILAGLESRGITGFIPLKSNEPGEGNPARRADLTTPVPEHLWPKLPKNPQGQLDKSCFVYVAERNEYICPNSRVLRDLYRESRNGVEVHRYKCASCEGCPLVASCLSHAKNTTPEQRTQANGRVRSISRDEYEDVRQRMSTHMALDSSKQQFNRRSAIAETPFAYLKGILGLRQFRHRGLEKVDHEWRWCCLTLNFKKLLRALARWRQLGTEFSDLQDAGQGTIAVAA
ncbi:MAG: IS1182 family transposase [Planctomycetota bacterium]